MTLLLAALGATSLLSLILGLAALAYARELGDRIDLIWDDTLDDELFSLLLEQHDEDDDDDPPTWVNGTPT